MTRPDFVFRLLTLCLALLGFWLAIRSLHQSRDISLQGEEHRLLLEWASANSTVGNAEDTTLRMYEQRRWALWSHQFMQDNLIIYFFVHGFRWPDPQRDQEVELLSKDDRFWLVQAQDRMRKAIPGQLNLISDIADDRTAAQKLITLVEQGYYAQLFDNWDMAKRQCLEAVPDSRRRERVSQMFAVVENSKPRKRGEMPLAWIDSLPTIDKK